MQREGGGDGKAWTGMRGGEWFMVLMGSQKGHAPDAERTLIDGIGKRGHCIASRRTNRHPLGCIGFRRTSWSPATATVSTRG